MAPTMWVWIAIGVLAVGLFGIALFRARHGWSTYHRPPSARNDHSASDAAAWLAKLDKPPGTGF